MLTIEQAQQLGSERATFRSNGNWTAADQIRIVLDEAGYQTQDHTDGSWEIISIQEKLNLQLQAEKRHIRRVYTRGDYTQEREKGYGGIAVLLRRAAKKDNLPHLKRLLSAAVLVVQEDEDKNKSDTTKDEDSSKSNENTSSALLNIGNLNNKAALHFAAQNSGPNMVRFILRHGGNANATCLRGQTPICFAIAKRRYKNVEVLLEAGAVLHVRTVLGETPLDLARVHIEPPRRGLLYRLEEHFAKEENNNNEANNNKTSESTSESTSTSESSSESTSTSSFPWIDFTSNKLAIENQCNHALSCKNCQENARAMLCGESTIITSQMDIARNKNNTQHDGYYDDIGGPEDDSDQEPDEQWDRWVEGSKCLGGALHTKIRKAAAGNDPEKLKNLLKQGKEASEYKPTMEEKALMKENNQKQRPPIQYSTLVESPSPGSGRTALMLAAWRGCVENVALLLDEGAEMNRYTKRSGNYGKTPLFYALTRCRDEIVTLLVERGASVLIINNKGQTPRSIGVSHLNEDTLFKLVQEEEKQLNNYQEKKKLDTTTPMSSLSLDDDAAAIGAADAASDIHSLRYGETDIEEINGSFEELYHAQKKNKKKKKKGKNQKKVPFINPDDINRDCNGWLNFRSSHSDGVAYGDLDIRFLDGDNLEGTQFGWSGAPTTDSNGVSNGKKMSFSEYLNRMITVRPEGR